MILYDESNGKSLTNITILLTPEEASELISALKRLTTEPGDHVHIDNEAYSKEITIALYTPDNAKTFARHFQELIITEAK